MGQSVSHCSVCHCAVARATKGSTDCVWCAEFVNNINSTARVTKSYNLHEYTPLHHFSGGLAARHDARHVKSFAGKIDEKTMGKGFGVFGRVQSTPDADGLGAYFHTFPAGYRGAFRHDFAVPRAWNAGAAHVPLAVPPGVVWYEGAAAAQPGFSGGARQVFIPVAVARALFEPSCKFLDSPGAASYKTFIKECAPAFEAQKAWQAAYRREADHIRKHAADCNELRAIRELFARGDALDHANCYERARRFAPQLAANRAKRDELVQKIEDAVQGRDPQRFRHFTLIAAGVLAAAPHRAEMAGLPTWLQQLLRREVKEISTTDGTAPPGGGRFVLRDFGGGVSVEVRFKETRFEPPSTTVYVYEVVTAGAGGCRIFK